jgi:hypothetical protein
MKPVVFAHEYDTVKENLRHSRKYHDPSDYDDWSNPAHSMQEVADPIDIQ